jgi:hypothetical protein
MIEQYEFESMHICPMGYAGYCLAENLQHVCNHAHVHMQCDADICTKKPCERAKENDFYKVVCEVFHETNDM